MTDRTADRLSLPHQLRGRSHWRPLLACSVALLGGALLLSLLPTANEEAVADVSTGNLAVQQTLVLFDDDIVQARPFPLAEDGIEVRGVVTQKADVQGKAPVGGAIARWIVDPGTQVVAGQPIVEISSGAARRPPTSAEREQEVAEREQVRLADQQLRLAQELSISQTKLRSAQESVERAESRVKSARELVAQVRRGELDGVLPASSDAKPEQSGKSQPGEPPRRLPNQRENERAVARRSVESASKALDATRREIAEATKSIGDARNRLSVAEVGLSSVEDSFRSGNLSAAELQESRVAVGQAEAEVKQQEERLANAKRQLPVRENTLQTRQAQLEKLQTEAASANTRTANTADSGPDQSNQQQNQQQQERALVRVATLVDNALNEARTASQNAAQLRTRIDELSEQSRTNQTQLEAANARLSEAQQKVLDAAPRPRFTSATAPRDGRIVWISRLATEVGPGDAVFGLSTQDQSFVQFESPSTATKRLQIGQILEVTPTETALGESEAQAAESSATPASTPSQLSSQSSPLTSDGSAVEITTLDQDQITARPLDNLDIAPGTSVVALVPTTDPKRLSVPLSAIAHFNNRRYIAVLKPARDTSRNIEQKASAKPTEDTASDATKYRMVWREVSTGATREGLIEIKRGLRQRDRILKHAQPVLDQSSLDAASPLIKLASVEDSSTETTETAPQTTDDAQNNAPQPASPQPQPTNSASDGGNLPAPARREVVPNTSASDQGLQSSS